MGTYGRIFFPGPPLTVAAVFRNMPTFLRAESPVNVLAGVP